MREALKMGRSTGDDTVSTLVAAARQCFASTGVRGTRMDDIARAAGLSRQAVYRYVSGREDLVELVIIERCREFASEAEAAMPAATTEVPVAMTDVLVHLIAAARADQEFGMLASAMPRVRLNLLLSSASSPVHQMLGDCFATLFERGHREGLLRTDITRRETVEWLQGVLMTYVPRVDLDVTEVRRFVHEFAVRSLLA
jgi:AcrR family transcriptional regulator